MATTITRVLVLLLTDSKVQAGFLAVTNQAVSTLQLSQMHEYSGSSAAVGACDAALQELNAETESVSNCIFICDPHWFVGTALAKEKELLIQQIATELSLKPLGFVLTHEAIVHALALDATVSGVLVVLDSHSITQVVIDKGVELATETMARTADLTADISAGLEKISSEKQLQLPARIWLASSSQTNSQLEQESESLHASELVERAPFVSQPVIETLKQETTTMMLHQEAGRAAAVAQGSNPPPIHLQHTGTQATSSVDPVDSAAQDLFGQDLDNSVTVDSPELRSVGAPTTPEKIAVSIPDLSPDLVQAELKQASSRQPSHKKFIIGGFILGLATLIIGLGLYLRMYSAIAVTVTRLPEVVSAESLLLLDPTASQSDPQTGRVAATTVTTTVSDQATLATSGVKIVGEAATGQLRVFNKTTDEIEIESGEQLRAGEQTFQLTDDVIVPPAVITEKTGGEERDYGEAKVTAAAVVIGEEGNISEGTELLFTQISQVNATAQVDEEFTGGTSREVAVVSEQDRVELLEELRSLLLTEANQELNNSAGSGEYVHTTDQITSETAIFSAEVGEETSELTLELELTVEALSYTAADLEPVIQGLLQANVPAGYSLLDEDPEVLSAPAEATQAATFAIDANVSAKAVPTINESELREMIIGKRPADAQTTLLNSDLISEAEVMVVPSFAAPILGVIPNDDSRIVVTIL